MLLKPGLRLKLVLTRLQEGLVAVLAAKPFQHVGVLRVGWSLVLIHVILFDVGSLDQHIAVLGEVSLFLLGVESAHAADLGQEDILVFKPSVAEDALGFPCFFDNWDGCLLLSPRIQSRNHFVIKVGHGAVVQFLQVCVEALHDVK